MPTIPLPDGHEMPSFAAFPTIESAQAGAWQDPLTWSRGRAPYEADIVAIDHDVVISDPNQVARAAVIGVRRGTLALWPAVQLWVRTLQVYPGGTLDVVNDLPSASFATEIRFFPAPADPDHDPEQFAGGLIALGNVRIMGALKTPMARLARGLAAGTHDLPLHDPVQETWEIGDQVLIPDSRHLPLNDWGARQVEIGTIVSIAGDGLMVRLARPLQFDHPAAWIDDHIERIAPMIANLTRNIILRSATGAERAHCLFSGHGQVDIRGAAFLDLGRTTTARLDSTLRDAAGLVTRIGTNQAGRYPIHRHHHHGPHEATENGTPFRLAGCVVRQSVDDIRWGIVTHQSHYGEVQGNIVHRAGGAGIVTEDGNESQNLFTHNFVCEVSGRGRADARAGEWGVDGSAFFFRGGDNLVNHNVANGAQYGFSYYSQYARRDLLKPSLPWHHADTPVDVNATPIRQCFRNEAFGCKNGFQLWWIGAISERPIQNMERSTVNGLVAWHCAVGVSGYESGNLTFNDCLVIGDPAKVNEFGGGFGFSDYLQAGLQIIGCGVFNMRTGITVPAIADARWRTGNEAGRVRIERCRLRCASNVVVPIPWHNATAAGLAPLRVELVECIWEKPARASEWRWHIQTGVAASEFTNYVTPVSITVDHREGGVELAAGHVWPPRFRVFAGRQTAQALLPPISSFGRIIGAPRPGMTNAEALAQFGIAAGGELAPALALVLDGINGPAEGI